MLHAEHLALPHPVEARHVQVEAAPPAGFDAVIAPRRSGAGRRSVPPGRSRNR
jgi:hypothetical protein